MPLCLGVSAHLLIAIIALERARPAFSADDYAFYHENVMGTSLELVVRTESAAAAQAAEVRVLREIDRLSGIFSGYDPKSELSRWQSAPPGAIPVSHEFFELLDLSDQWTVRSHGAFDPRVEVLTRLWSKCAAVNRLPSADEEELARRLKREPAWQLEPVTQSARRLSDCPITLNGIAKGYIVGKACEVALDRSKGTTSMLLNIGGDLRALGDVARKVSIASPWADSESSEPFAAIEIKNQSVATSGRSQRGFSIGGRWYSHVFDPRSGQPVERVASATVVAREAADADALAKACSVLAPEESLALVESLTGVECLIILNDGQAARSRGWRHLETALPEALALADDPKPKTAAGTVEKAAKAEKKTASATPWNKDLELVVNFEINQPESQPGRYRRPYVAIWVEDEDGYPVRTLSLWVSMAGSGPFQWLPDLKRWYVKDQERRRAENKKEIFFTVARPTRAPGKYKVIWDGKDNHGKQLPGGQYTITIEAAREHGTYQSIRKQVTLAAKPFTEELKGNVEIKSASIDYRKKPTPKK
jgi:thiamine biosynthesis lipoprotein ApbE